MTRAGSYYLGFAVKHTGTPIPQRLEGEDEVAKFRADAMANDATMSISIYKLVERVERTTVWAARDDDLVQSLAPVKDEAS